MDNLRKVRSSKTEPGRNRNYEQPNDKHWNWSCDQASPKKQTPRTRWLHRRILSYSFLNMSLSTTSPQLQWGWVEGLWRPVVRWLDAQRRWQWQIPLRSLPAQPKAKGIGWMIFCHLGSWGNRIYLHHFLPRKKAGISALLDLEMRRQTPPGIKQWADGFSSSPWIA